MNNRIPWSELCWYALQVPPQKEFIAQAILKRKGVDSYVPVRKEWRRRNKYTKTKELRSFPVAPRYVFAGFPRRTPLWFDLFALPVINGVVGIEGKPMRIPYEDTSKAKDGGENRPGLARIIRTYPNGIVAPKEQRFMVTHGEFSAGDVVEVIDGPFEGRRVPVIELKDGDAVVGTWMFGAAHEITIPVEKLVKYA